MLAAARLRLGSAAVAGTICARRGGALLRARLARSAAATAAGRIADKALGHHMYDRLEGRCPLRRAPALAALAARRLRARR